MDFVKDMPWLCPVTKLYRHGDQHYAITCADFYTAQHTEVFLADAAGELVDADGDPTNSLTALVRWDDHLTHTEAAARLTEWLSTTTTDGGTS